MKIQTSDGERSVSSKALGGTALGLAIPGTLSFLGQLGNSLLGMGNNNAMVYPSPYHVDYNFFGNQNQHHDGRIIAAQGAEIQKLQSEKYTDEAIAEQREKTAALNEKVYGFVIELDKRISAIETAAPLREQLINQKIDCCCEKTSTALAALNSVVEQITKTVVPKDAICPEVMARFNSWVAPTDK